MQAQEIDILALEKKQSTSSNALMQQDIIITQIELYFYITSTATFLSIYFLENTSEDVTKIKLIIGISVVNLVTEQQDIYTP